jgi:hypothetical protein
VKASGGLIFEAGGTTVTEGGTLTEATGSDGTGDRREANRASKASLSLGSEFVYEPEGYVYPRTPCKRLDKFQS